MIGREETFERIGSVLDTLFHRENDATYSKLILWLIEQFRSFRLQSVSSTTAQKQTSCLETENQQIFKTGAQIARDVSNPHRLGGALVQPQFLGMAVGTPLGRVSRGVDTLFIDEIEESYAKIEPERAKYFDRLAQINSTKKHYEYFIKDEIDPGIRNPLEVGEDLQHQSEELLECTEKLRGLFKRRFRPRVELVYESSLPTRSEEQFQSKSDLSEKELKQTKLIDEFSLMKREKQYWETAILKARKENEGLRAQLQEHKVGQKEKTITLLSTMVIDLRESLDSVKSERDYYIQEIGLARSKNKVLETRVEEIEGKLQKVSPQRLREKWNREIDCRSTFPTRIKHSMEIYFAGFISRAYEVDSPVQEAPAKSHRYKFSGDVTSVEEKPKPAEQVRKEEPAIQSFALPFKTQQVYSITLRGTRPWQVPQPTQPTPHSKVPVKLKEKKEQAAVLEGAAKQAKPANKERDNDLCRQGSSMLQRQFDSNQSSLQQGKRNSNIIKFDKTIENKLNQTSIIEHDITAHLSNSSSTQLLFHNSNRHSNLSVLKAGKLAEESMLLPELYRSRLSNSLMNNVEPAKEGTKQTNKQKYEGFRYVKKAKVGVRSSESQTDNDLFLEYLIDTSLHLQGLAKKSLCKNSFMARGRLKFDPGFANYQLQGRSAINFKQFLPHVAEPEEQAKIMNLDELEPLMAEEQASGLKLELTRLDSLVSSKGRTLVKNALFNRCRAQPRRSQYYDAIRLKVQSYFCTSKLKEQHYEQFVAKLFTEHNNSCPEKPLCEHLRRFLERLGFCLRPKRQELRLKKADLVM